MYATHCDRESCDSWQPLDGELPQFITVVGPTNWGRREFHFDSLDCLMHWAAKHSMPTEAVSNEGN
jgi:hypothetical protein